MQGIMKRKLIGLIIACLLWPLLGLIALFNISGMVVPMIAVLSGPVGLLIMGPRYDGQPGLLVRLFKLCAKIGKWGWLLIPYFPIDVVVGLIAIVIGIWVFLFGAIMFAFVPALVDFLDTLIAVKKGRA